MIPRTLDMISKVRTLLIEKEYVTGEEIRKVCHLSRSSVYYLIRNMRLSGVGIIPTPKGYILAEFAKKSDDIHLIRRCMGRRAADILTMQSAYPYMKERWKKKKDWEMIRPVLSQLMTSKVLISEAKENMKLLLSSQNNLKV